MDRTISYPDAPQRPLTPRQDRLEGSIVAVLSANGTRSELRDLVHELADVFRLQGVSEDRAIATMRALGSRAMPAMAERSSGVVGDSADDRIGMMTQWCTARFRRVD